MSSTTLEFDLSIRASQWRKDSELTRQHKGYFTNARRRRRGRAPGNFADLHDLSVGFFLGLPKPPTLTRIEAVTRDIKARHTTYDVSDKWQALGLKVKYLPTSARYPERSL